MLYYYVYKRDLQQNGCNDNVQARVLRLRGLLIVTLKKLLMYN